MRWLRPAVFLLLGVTGLLAVLPRVLGSTDAPNAEACRELGSQEAVERCLVAAMLDSGSLGSAARVLGDALEKDERLQLACHEATHEVGQRLYASSFDFAGFLRLPESGVCEWGLVHGTLAAVAAADPGRVDGFLDVCVALSDRGAGQACGDSVGHALWEIDRSFPSAVARCMRATSPVGDACVSGVFMQFYRPVAPTSGEDAGEWSPPLSRREVRGLCAALEDERASVACAAAAHYAFAPDLQQARDRVLAATDPRAAADSVFVPVLDEAASFCAGFPGDAGDRCAMEVSRYALQMLRYLEAGAVESLVCGRFAAPGVRSYCRSAADSILRTSPS